MLCNDASVTLLLDGSTVVMQKCLNDYLKGGEREREESGELAEETDAILCNFGSGGDVK